MSIFNSILSKLGFGEEKKSPDVQAQPAREQTPSTAPGSPTPAPGAAEPGKTVSEVDVLSKLDSMAKSHAEQLNWKTSIVDLLKLLGLDSSLGARKELAKELGCPEEKMGDSAQMNIWLHQTVLKKLAENGGNIPAELLK